MQNAFSWSQPVINLHFVDNFPKQTFTVTYKKPFGLSNREAPYSNLDENAMHTMVL